MAKAKAVTIVVPVYADWPSLKDCISSLKKFVDPKHQILLVNDCGPEADALERQIISAIKGDKRFRYESNDENLGFVGTCNRAVNQLDKTNNDILLLNSDTQPTAGWLGEMQKVLYMSPKHCAVSPRSNNASIATLPLSRAIHHGIDAADSFEIYIKISSKLPKYYIAPVALGFCMMIKRTLINKYGLFDPIFGKGYGEEVDFCRRLKELGYASVISNHAYVFHLEAKSFTPERKKKLIDKNNQILWQRYPHYRQENRDWMDKKVPAETTIEQSMGFDLEPKASGIRGVLKRYPRVYRLARSVYRKFIDRFD